MVRASLNEVLGRVRRRRSVILCYHGIDRSTARQDPKFLQTDPCRFRTHAELLLGAGFEFVTLSELSDRAGGGEPPPGLVALTFDDGYADNHSILLPILREYGLPATVYVATGLIGKRNPFLAEGSDARMMTAEELLELAAEGIELGAHTVTHPDLSTLDPEASLREMVESRAYLERLTGKAVTTFAYPFCHYTATTVAAARDAGFETAVTCARYGSWAPLEMKRSVITGKDGLPSFVLKVAERYDPLFHSRAGRLARAVTRAARARARDARERPRTLG